MDTSLDRDPLSGVSVFVTAARAGTFTAAAKRMSLTKSAVGKAISRLEDRLGFKLFHRTTRLTKLTADGEAFLAACVSAMDEIAAAQAALSSNHQILSGRLHIDMPVAFGRHVLLPALIDITRPHPGLSLTLTFTDSTSDLLKEDVDLAIRFGALPNSSDLVARRLVTQERVICASPDYLRAHGEPGSLAEVRAHRCIVGSVKGPPLDWFVLDGGVEKHFRPPATHRLSDGEAMVAAAIGGLGFIQMPMSLVRGPIAKGLLKAVLPSYSVGVEVHAVWPRQAHLSPRVRYVIDQLAAYAVEGRLD
ncbi:LysR substrate-binding domain-containing protein [Variovorax robiniae]|uniref:LysR substrate-binding domain-containing protein n=1 Tax=Variovorax robiniae TaxID=1836199 RepID=A0ABU8XHA1_9BURK